MRYLNKLGNKEVAILKNSYIPILEKYFFSGSQGYPDYQRDFLALTKEDHTSYTRLVGLIIGKLIGDIKCCYDDVDPNDAGEISETHLGVNAAFCLDLLKVILNEHE